MFTVNGVITFLKTRVRGLTQHVGEGAYTGAGPGDSVGG